MHIHKYIPIVSVYDFPKIQTIKILSHITMIITHGYNQFFSYIQETRG